MLKPPTEQEIWSYVAFTHHIDRVKLGQDEVINTWHQKGLVNPFAQGHFRAIMYIIHKLLPSNDFPLKDGAVLNNVPESETALFWLRELHRKMADPLINHMLLIDDVNAPSSMQVGSYRMMPAMAVISPCPPPDMIPKLMYNWLKDYSDFHNKIKDQINNPYAFDKEMAYQIIRKAYEVNLFFCSIQPMGCLNQRFGRLLENCYRLGWNLNLKMKQDDHFVTDLEKYQNEQVPILIRNCSSVR